MDIRKMLEERVPILFDGAMGTAYSALPGRSVKRCELANLDEPETIIEIHKSYLDVGVQAIKTNTFSVGNDIDDGNYTLAKQLIEAGETASRAAYRVGFGDYSAFYRAYVKIVGKSPTA
jgi:homocysteine S-methyltransferase